MVTARGQWHVREPMLGGNRDLRFAGDAVQV
jgi:hypothetical protein